MPADAELNHNSRVKWKKGEYELHVVGSCRPATEAVKPKLLIVQGVTLDMLARFITIADQVYEHSDLLFFMDSISARVEVGDWSI